MAAGPLIVPLLFAALGIHLLVHALRPRARRTWSWGRGGGSVGLSRVSYAIVGMTLLLAGAVLFTGPHPPLLLAALLLASVLGVIVSGIVDTRRARRAHPLPDYGTSGGKHQ